MIAATSSFHTNRQADCHARFVQMLPLIHRVASFCFRRERRAVREDLIAEVIANSYVAFARLAERDKLDVAFPTVLARFAVRQIRAGRRVGNPCDIRGLCSSRAQRAGVFVHGLFEQNAAGKWEELAVEDKRSTPAQVAITRLDFRAWLASLTMRNRRIAEALAVGDGTMDVAKRFSISPARVSQLRRELYEHWQAYQGEPVAEAA